MRRAVRHDVFEARGIDPDRNAQGLDTRIVLPRPGQFGGFVGTRAGKVFADLAVQYSRRDYDYRRNVCAIETPTTTDPIVADPGSPSGFSMGGVDLDDIYAGKIKGSTKHTEWSVSGRAGYDFGNERLLWGPRLSLTYLRSKIDGFSESGRTRQWLIA
jgi:uncharacterized protein YhjY with autotransporter beta-barrel domain